MTLTKKIIRKAVNLKLEYNNILAKGYVTNWSEEVLWLKKVKNTMKCWANRLVFIWQIPKSSSQWSDVKWSQSKAGVLQDSALWTLLFLVYTDDLP